VSGTRAGGDTVLPARAGGTGPAEGVRAPTRVPDTAVVLAQDCAGVIARCLRSLSFADEVLVVDGGSHDGTAELAGSLGARVLVNRWPGFAAQRRFGLEAARHEWVFVCDADEEATPELAAEIASALRGARAGEAVGGFRIRRRNQFLGRWMDVGPWARDHQLRLFRRGVARVTGASVHEGYEVDGAVGTLTARLHHYAHPTLTESIRRLNRYTSLEARDRASRRRIRALDPLLSPAGVFLKYYVVKGCWRAGVRGYLLAAITAMYKSILYVKIRAQQRAGGEEGHG
jgi:glycosyltransferase involved in cell wall biosynthesis